MFAEPEGAEAQLAAVEQHPQADDGCQAPLQVEMQSHIAAIRALVAYLSGDTDRAVVLSHQALELWPEMDAAVRSYLIAILGVGCRAHNDLAGAARYFAQSMELTQASGNVMLEVVLHTSLGRVSEIMGRLREAEAIYREGLDKAILHRSPAAGQAYRFLANVCREWNDLASAMLLAEKSIEPSRMWGHANPLVEGLLTLARIHQAQNNTPEANRALAEADEAIHGHLLEATTIQWIGAIRARLWLAQGELDDARRWSEARGLSAEAELDLENEIEYLTVVRLLLAEGRVDEAQHLLARLQSAAESTGRQGSLIEVLVLQAVALNLRADTDAALAALEQALGLARSEGYMRVFLDEGKPMGNLLKIAITKWKDQELLAYARGLLNAFYQGEAERPVPPKTLPGGPLIEPLTERELEVLHLVAAGWTNQEIAGKLVISVRTVKKHVENIYGKLGVRSRAEAGARARELNLL
jgi:LuxR family maltose regulon positive regulatory protein